MDKISESGFIGQDGRLRMPMDRLNQEFARHKGQRVIMCLEFGSPGSTSLQQAYYYNYILPCIVDGQREKGVYMSEAKADRWLVEQYPGELIKDGARPNFGRELNKSQMSDFLEWLKQFAAENLSVYIEDPKNI